jgi:hypothetical protein
VVGFGRVPRRRALSETILTRLVEAYRKLRNTFRYLLGNLHDFDPQKDAMRADEMQEIDQWILVRAESWWRNCRAWYDDFEFHKVYRAVYDFATVDLSSVYFDVLKDRLYCSAPNRRRGAARRPRSTAWNGCAGAAAGADHELHRRRSLDAHGPAGERALALFPEPGELTAGLGETARARRQLGPADGNARRCA